MKAPTSDNWGKEGYLEDVLGSAKSDEPDTGSIHRLRSRLIQAGVVLGVGTISTGVAAAAKGAAVMKATATAGGVTGFGLGIKIGASVAVAAVLTIGVIHSPLVKDTQNPIFIESAADGHLKNVKRAAAHRSASDKEIPVAGQSDANRMEAAEPVVNLQTEEENAGSKPSRRLSTQLQGGAEPLSSSVEDTTQEQAPTESTVPAASIADEVKLIEEAEDALYTNPKRTLELTETHRASFEDGLLGMEREILTINALLRLHKTYEACERATDFIRKNPDSPYIGRLRESCGETGQELDSD